MIYEIHILYTYLVCIWEQLSFVTQNVTVLYIYLCPKLLLPFKDLAPWAEMGLRVHCGPISKWEAPKHSSLGFCLSLSLLLGELRQQGWRVPMVFFCSSNSSNSRNCISLQSKCFRVESATPGRCNSEPVQGQATAYWWGESVFFPPPIGEGTWGISTNTSEVLWMAGGSEGWWQWPQTCWQFLSATGNAL